MARQEWCAAKAHRREMISQLKAEQTTLRREAQTVVLAASAAATRSDLCMACGERPAQMLMLRCRHATLCRACWIDAPASDEGGPPAGVPCEVISTGTGTGTGVDAGLLTRRRVLVDGEWVLVDESDLDGESSGIGGVLPSGETEGGPQEEGAPCTSEEGFGSEEASEVASLGEQVGGGKVTKSRSYCAVCGQSSHIALMMYAV